MGRSCGRKTTGNPGRPTIHAAACASHYRVLINTRRGVFCRRDARIVARRHSAAHQIWIRDAVATTTDVRTARVTNPRQFWDDGGGGGGRRPPTFDRPGKFRMFFAQYATRRCIDKRLLRWPCQRKKRYVYTHMFYPFHLRGRFVKTLNIN